MDAGVARAGEQRHRRHRLGRRRLPAERSAARAPPDMGSWAAHVPAWFWLTFVVMLMTSVGGCGAMGYVLHTVRRFQKRQDGGAGTRLRHGTSSALARLEERVQTMCDGM